MKRQYRETICAAVGAEFMPFSLKSARLLFFVVTY